MQLKNILINRVTFYYFSELTISRGIYKKVPGLFKEPGY